MRKKNRGSYRRFVLIEVRTLKSEEWANLTTSEKLVYIQIKANYNGGNNGEISFKYADCQFSNATIAKALRGLERKGWIEKTQHGGLYRYYCLYRITEKYDALR